MTSLRLLIRPWLLTAAVIVAAAAIIGHPAPRSESQPDIPVSDIHGAIPSSGWDTPVSTATVKPAATQSGAPEVAGFTFGVRSGAPSESPTPRQAPAPTSRGTTAATSPRPSRSGAPRSVASGTPRPVPASRATGESVAGLMSWYCLAGRSACTAGHPASCLCGAAGPVLRAALGDWRGRTITVSTNRSSVDVVLVDWCQCPGGRVLDGYAAVWFGLGVPLDAGLVDVSVSW